jgi:uncharacterized protein YecE (DUF72 family)
MLPTESVTAPIGYVRLHGRNYDEWFEGDQPHDRYNHLYSEAELMNWKERIEHVAQRSRTTYVLANNHFEAKSAVNALQLRNLLRGERVLAPETLLENYPDLRNIADPLPDLSHSSLPLLA